MAIPHPESTSTLSFTPRLDEHSKKLYLRHENIAKVLAGKDAQYVNALQQARNSAKDAKKAVEIVTQISHTEKKLTEQIEHLESKKLKKRLFPNKTNEKITKLRNNLEAVVEEAALAKKAASQVKKQARAHAKVRDRLRADAEKLQHSESTRRAILETVYGGRESGSVEENNIETERDRLVLVTDQAKDSLSVHMQALNLLNSGYEELRKARRLLHDAQVTNTLDLFNGGGFGFVAGITTQYTFQEAAKTARAAGKQIEEAIILNPQLPIAKLAKQHHRVFIGLADIFLDGIVTDLVVRMAVEKAVKSVNDAMKSTEDSILYQQQVVNVAKGDFTRFSSELERTSDELTRVRADLLHEEIDDYPSQKR